ncbi:MAG: hypothetical protein LBQ33_04365 [Oscillospiraceae bacterium]|nr:hypothetical protein [Oscillospiraceae bacterium]
MKNAAKFALVMCLVVLAAAAVLSVTYPGLRDDIALGFQHFFEGAAEFIRDFAEAFRAAAG